MKWYWKVAAVLGVSGATIIGYNYFKPQYNLTSEVVESKRVQEAVHAVQPPLHEAYEIVNVAVANNTGLTVEEAKTVWKKLLEAKLKLANAEVEAAIMSKDLFEKGICRITKGKPYFYSMGTTEYEQNLHKVKVDPQWSFIKDQAKSTNQHFGAPAEARRIHAEHMRLIEELRVQYNKLKNLTMPEVIHANAEDTKKFFNKYLDEAAPKILSVKHTS